MDLLQVGFERPGEEVLQRLLVPEQLLLEFRQKPEPFDHTGLAAARELRLQVLELNDALEESLQALAPEGLLSIVPPHQFQILECEFEEVVLERDLVLDVALRLALLHAEQRRLGDVKEAALHDLLHLPVEKSEEQGADVRPVHVRIGHDDHAVVAQSVDVEVVGPDPRAQRRDERLDLLTGDHLVEAGLLDVQDLPFKRQDRLVSAVAPLLGGAARALALDDEQLALRGILLLAVGEFPREGRTVQRPLPSREIPRLARRIARPGRFNSLRHDLLCNGGVLLKELAELLIHQLLDDPFHLGVSKLRLRLPLELRVLDLHGDHAGESLPHVLARETLLYILQKTNLLRVVVQRPRQGRLEADEV